MINSVPFRLAVKQSVSCLKLSEWRALLFALMMAITISGLMAALGDRIERTLMRQGSALLGGDLLLSHTRPLEQRYLSTADKLGLRHTQVTQLATMANHADNFLLVTVRSLTAPYPSGQIELDSPSPSPLPSSGEAWAEIGVYERLGLQPGDQIQLGNHSFTLTRIIRSAPDRGRGFISFNPQLIIPEGALEGTGLLGPGARMQYRQLFAGSPDQIKVLATELQKTIPSGVQLTALKNDESQQNSALTKSSSYLRLGALFALLISAMTIFLSLRRFTQSQFKRAALLKSLGLSERQLLQLYISQLAIAWLICSLTGISLALVLERLGLFLLQGLLPQPIPDASWFVYATGAILGGAILLGMGIPALLVLQKSNTSQLLQSRAVRLSWRGRLPYVIALFTLIACSALYLNNLTLTLSLIAILLIAGIVLGWLGAYIASRLTQRLAPYHRLGHLLNSRVIQQQRWYRVQIPVICLLFALLSTNLIALNDLLGRWQAQLPAETPNHFLINIQEWERAEVEQLLQQNGIVSTLWPIYRGRLTKVNGQPLADVLTPEQLDQPSLKRELNLTSATGIPEHNRLVAGRWQPQGGVSIEQKEAEELGLEIGDQISFDIAGREATAEISSIRTVRWDSFQPNFYFIFSPGVLENFTPSYMTSFHLTDNSADVSRQLISQFPTLTLIDVRQILSQLQQLLERLSLLSTLLMLLTSSAGLVLLYVTLTQELEQRRYENALLQTLGASQHQCRQLDQLEMGLIGGLSGLLAVVITELSLWSVHQQLLKLEPALHPYLWVSLPLIGCGLFIAVSQLSHRQQNLNHSYQTLINRI